MNMASEPSQGSIDESGETDDQIELPYDPDVKWLGAGYIASRVEGILIARGEDPNRLLIIEDGEKQVSIPLKSFVYRGILPHIKENTSHSVNVRIHNEKIDRCVDTLLHDVHAYDNNVGFKETREWLLKNRASGQLDQGVAETAGGMDESMRSEYECACIRGYIRDMIHCSLVYELREHEFSEEADHILSGFGQEDEMQSMIAFDLLAKTMVDLSEDEIEKLLSEEQELLSDIPEDIRNDTEKRNAFFRTARFMSDAYVIENSQMGQVVDHLRKKNEVLIELALLAVMTRGLVLNAVRERAANDDTM